MDTCSIYLITNAINNKVYVGQTWSSIEQRFWNHKNPKNKKSPKLYNAFNKYGRENFSIELLTVAGSQAVADYLENWWIDFYDSINSGYNLMPGGRNKKHTEESKKKMSEIKMGAKNPRYGVEVSASTRKKMADNARKNMSPEKRQKMTEGLRKSLKDNPRGPMPQKHKDSISRGNKGKPKSAEHKRKTSEAKKLWWAQKKALAKPSDF